MKRNDEEEKKSEKDDEDEDEEEEEPIDIEKYTEEEEKAREQKIKEKIDPWKKLEKVMEQRNMFDDYGDEDYDYHTKDTSFKPNKKDDSWFAMLR